MRARKDSITDVVITDDAGTGTLKISFFNGRLARAELPPGPAGHVLREGDALPRFTGADQSELPAAG
jgi:hypothetical protein